MIKNIRITHLLRHLFQSYILTTIFLTFTLLSTAFGQDETITETVTESARGLWSQVEVYGIVIIVLFLFSAFFYLLRLFQKDKLLKTLLNKYVVFQMKENKRYRGTMRLEFTGMEIISEESRQRGHAPSYIFTNEERDNQILAYVRYHDTMNERELRERAWELERFYHPPFIYKIRRKIRNMFVALREASKNAISMVLQSVKKNVGGQFQRYNTVYQKATDGKGDITGLDRLDQTTEHLDKQETYERLIERLVGTRIKVETETGVYTAILKDYNQKHIALMDVKDGDNNGYRDTWNYVHEYKHDINALNRRDDRGLRCRAEGNDENGYFLVFENNTPYQIQLGHVVLHDGAPEWARNYEFKHHIQAFSVQKLKIEPVAQHNVGPFQRIRARERLTIRNYKKIKLDFRSFRDADIIFPRKYCTIVESAEKYQPELFSLSGLTDTILDMSDTEDIAIADKEGKPIHGINVVHGYVTNVNEERIDLKTIDTSYSRRWDVENAFRRFDNKFRHGFPIHKRLLPINRAKITAHASIVEQIHDNAVRHEALAPLVYPGRSLDTAEQRARRRKLIRNRVVGGINAHFNTKFWKPNTGVPRTPGVTRAEVQMAMPIKLMAFTGNTSTVEFPVLQRFEYIQEHHMIYREVPDLRTDRLPKTDILWIGNGEIYKAGYRLNIDTEHRIKNFVSQGGVAIVSGQEITASTKQRRGTGWIPEPLTGIACDESYELFPTLRGKRSRIFQHPNPLNGNHHTDPEAMEQPLIRLDDMWLDPLGKWTSLAKTNIAAAGLPNDGLEKASALLLLPFQKGLYIVTSLKNETEEDVRINDKIMENLLHFSVKWLDKQRSPRKLERPIR
ncbi:transposase [Candidatus Poribacteria bacterium]|nr:transposase [Candidatus Poribacteria bacterium]MYH83883.1 transposase [Candidatus Poribacteria bacterium]